MRAVSIFAASVAALTLGGIVQAQDRLPRECRQEIRKLCGGDRSQLRECLRENVSELSDQCRTNLRSRLADRRGEVRKNSAAASAASEISFGVHALQKADFWPAHQTVQQTGAPLVLFVHGGGWKRGDKSMMNGSAKLAHWQAQGYAVASVNYRLVPDHIVEDQASDVAAAIAYFHYNAAALGIDADRIVLVGHSAGAHLVSLVGTDPQWLEEAALTMNDVAGVIALDGAGYMVPDQMDENAQLLGDTYLQAFGSDPARQLRLSPAEHTALPNVPAFLILHVERDDAEQQSKALGSRLQSAGTSAAVIGIEGRGLRGHREINEKLGQKAYPATALVDAFLAEQFAN